MKRPALQIFTDKRLTRGRCFDGDVRKWSSSIALRGLTSIPMLFSANKSLYLRLATDLHQGAIMMSILRKARLKDKEMRILMLWV